MMEKINELTEILGKIKSPTRGRSRNVEKMSNALGYDRITERFFM